MAFFLEEDRMGRILEVATKKAGVKLRKWSRLNAVKVLVLGDSHVGRTWKSTSSYLAIGESGATLEHAIQMLSRSTFDVDAIVLVYGTNYSRKVVDLENEIEELGRLLHNIPHVPKLFLLPGTVRLFGSELHRVCDFRRKITSLEGVRFLEQPLLPRHGWHGVHFSPDGARIVRNAVRDELKSMGVVVPIE